MVLVQRPFPTRTSSELITSLQGKRGEPSQASSPDLKHIVKHIDPSAQIVREVAQPRARLRRSAALFAHARPLPMREISG